MAARGLFLSVTYIPYKTLCKSYLFTKAARPTRAPPGAAADVTSVTSRQLGSRPRSAPGIFPSLSWEPSSLVKFRPVAQGGSGGVRGGAPGRTPWRWLRARRRTRGRSSGTGFPSETRRGTVGGARRTSTPPTGRTGSVCGSLLRTRWVLAQLQPLAPQRTQVHAAAHAVPVRGRGATPHPAARDRVLCNPPAPLCRFSLPTQHSPSPAVAAAMKLGWRLVAGADLQLRRSRRSCRTAGSGMRRRRSQLRF